MSNAYLLIALAGAIILEGEVAFALAILSIHLFQLSIPELFVFVFCITLLSDWLYFLIGRLIGPYLFVHFKFLQRKGDSLHSMIHRHATILLLGYRFLYGFRIIFLLLFGMNKTIPVSRFIFLSALSAFLWTMVIGSLVLSFKEIVQGFLENESFQILVFSGVFILILFIFSRIAIRLTRRMA